MDADLTFLLRRFPLERRLANVPVGDDTLGTAPTLWFKLRELPHVRYSESEMGSPIDSIDIAGEITMSGLEEAVAVTGTKDTLPRRLLDYYVLAFGLTQGAVMAYYGSRGVISYSFGPDRDVFRFFLSLAILAVPVGFAVWLVRKEQSRRRSLRSLLGPVTLSISADGIKTSAPGHAAQSWQWDECRGYYVGHHTIACLSDDGSGSILIPVGNLSSGELAEVRALLAAHLAEMDLRQLRDAARQSLRKP